MSRLTGLDPSYVDGNVALAVLLGAMSAGATVRAVLPVPDPALRASEPSAATDEPDPFVALLLGAVVMHERLTSIVAVDAAPADGSVHVDVLSTFLGGLLR